MMTVDFDRAVREARREKIAVRAFGNVYEIPAGMPLFVPMTLARYAEESELPAQVMLEIASAIFGDETVLDFAKSGMTEADLADLLLMTFRAMGGENQEENAVTEDGDVTSSRK